MTKHSQTTTLGIIPARYQSTRFPGKPLALIAGKTMIQRTYENAKNCSALDDLIVATDDGQIFEHVESFGGKAIMTSAKCPTGTDRLADAITNTENLCDYQIILNVQGDEPLLEPDILESVINALKKSPEAVAATAVAKLETEEEALNASIVKCVLDQNNFALYFSRGLIPCDKTGKWNPDTVYYKHLGIYAYRREFLMEYTKLAQTPLQIAEDLEQLKILEHGFKIKTAIVESRSSGVDLPVDIQKIERML